MSNPAATDYGCPECFADRVLADRDDRAGICAKCGWFGPLQDESAPPASPTQEELHFKMFPSTREGYDQAVAHAKHSPANPSSPEPETELIAWLDELDECDPDTPAWDQARAEIRALYTRQREEIEWVQSINSALNESNVRLLERLKAATLTAGEALELLEILTTSGYRNTLIKSKLSRLSSDSGTGGDK